MVLGSEDGGNRRPRASIGRGPKKKGLVPGTGDGGAVPSLVVSVLGMGLGPVPCTMPENNGTQLETLLVQVARG